MSRKPESDLLPNDGAFVDSEPPPRRIWMYLGVGVFLLMAIFWIGLFARGRGLPHPDELAIPNPDSPAETEVETRDQAAALNFQKQAEAVCATAQSDIAALPLAAAAEDFSERATIIDSATDRLEAMVNDLGTVPKPTNDAEAFIVGEWIGDYYTFLDDRRAYSEVLRTGDDPPFVISARDGKRITNYIVTFAEVNNMMSCVPPGDV